MRPEPGSRVVGVDLQQGLVLRLAGEVLTCGLLEQLQGLANLALFDWISLGLELPVVVSQQGEAEVFGLGENPVADGGFGDLRFTPKVRILERVSSGFDLAILRRCLGHQILEQPAYHLFRFFDGAIERGLVGDRRPGRAADLAHELQRGRVDFVFRGRGLEVEQRADVPAHGFLPL